MTPDRLTWPMLVRREPALGRLRARARAIKDPGDAPYFCANTVWYDSFKPALIGLVGWYARSADPVVRSTRAYDLAYQTIYHDLPNCRGCQCA